MPLTPFDILKKTPRTNCGQCGLPSCLAFSAAVAAAGEDPDRCPFIDRTGLPAAATTVALDDAARERDLMLVRTLREKVARLPLRDMAPALGASFSPAPSSALLFSYLGQAVALTPSALTLDGTQPEDPRDMILLYNYVHAGGGPQAAGDWVGLESLPNSISKVKTLATYCEEPLSRLFSTVSAEAARGALVRLDAAESPQAGAAFGYVIPVLPRVPVYLLFWEADPEDGFPSRCKTLFDRQVLHFLDLESLVFAAERLADRLHGLLAPTTSRLSP